MKARVELNGILTRAPGKIGPANRADKQCVSRQHEPWLGPSLEVGHDEADTVQRMAGRVEHLQTGVTELDRRVWSCSTRGLQVSTRPVTLPARFRYRSTISNDSCGSFPKGKSTLRTAGDPTVCTRIARSKFCVRMDDKHAGCAKDFPSGGQPVCQLK